VTLLLAATSSSFATESSSQTSAVLDASFDAVWEATLSSLRDADYKISEEQRAKGFISARRTRLVRRSSEDEAARELQRIYEREARVGIDVRGLSEYYVTMTVRVRSGEPGKTGMYVRGQITAVRRRRGGAGMPQPVPIASNGVLEEELVQQVRERLAHGASEQAPP
jgi:hypothetical protein